MATCPVQPLVDAGRGFEKLSAQEATVVNIQLLCKILQNGNPMANCDAATLLNAGRGFMALSEKEAESVRLQLLCEILNGGIGATCLIGCASSGPVNPGPCAYSLAYSPGPNPGFWLWDASRAVWDEIQAPGP